MVTLSNGKLFRMATLSDGNPFGTIWIVCSTSLYSDHSVLLIYWLDPAVWLAFLIDQFSFSFSLETFESKVVDDLRETFTMSVTMKESVCSERECHCECHKHPNKLARFVEIFPNSKSFEVFSFLSLQWAILSKVLNLEIRQPDFNGLPAKCLVCYEASCSISLSASYSTSYIQHIQHLISLLWDSYEVLN